MNEPIPKTRLQAERLRRKWTQGEVAAKIQVDVKTYSRWERGGQTAHPGMIRALSVLFEEEVDSSWFRPLEMTEASPVSVWKVPKVPYERNPYFTDENNRVQHLHALLTSKGKEVLHVAISGLGGIGKTQLALEYTYRYRDSYKFIFWIRAGTQEQFLDGFVGIAYLFQVPEAKRPEPQQQYLINEALQWLRMHSGWLLVLDNVGEDVSEEDFDIALLLSTLKSGRILLTTRVQSIANLAQNFLLDVLQQEEGAQLLLRRSEILLSSGTLQMAESPQRDEALALSQLLGALPLALEQAAAYIQETKCGLAGYRQVYEVSRKDVLAAKAKYKRLYTDYSESVATTWLISFRRVEQQSAAASDFLKLFAYLAPDSIPEEMILKGAEKLGANLCQIAGNKYLFDSACQVLLSYSLIKRFAEGTMLSIHRLVQAVLQDSMDESAQRLWAAQAVQVVECAFTATTVEMIEQYLPHARTCATFIKKLALQGQEAAHLLEKTAKVVYDQGWYAQARPLYLRAHAAAIDLLGKTDPHTVSLSLDVARVHRDMGAASFAALIYRDAQRDLENLFGAEDSRVIQCMNELALAQIQAGVLSDAYQTCRDALSRSMQRSDPDVLQSAATYTLVARIAEGLRWNDRAESSYQRALDVRRRQLNVNHLEVAKSLDNLGTFYVTHQVNFEQAERLLRQALKIRQRILGHDHPETADSLVHLAMLLWEQKRYASAEEYYQRALAIRRQKLGLYHPGILQILHDLANIAAEQDKNEETEQYFHEIFAIAPHAGGTESYEYAILLKAYVDFLQGCGRLDEARQYQNEFNKLCKRLAMKGPLYSLNLPQGNDEGGPDSSSAIFWSF